MQLDHVKSHENSALSREMFHNYGSMLRIVYAKKFVAEMVVSSLDTGAFVS